MTGLAEWIFASFSGVSYKQQYGHRQHSASSHVNDIVSIADHINIMFDDYNGGTVNKV